MLRLTTCSVSEGALGRVKTGLRHVSVSFARKNLPHFLGSHIHAKAYKQARQCEDIKLNAVVSTHRLYKGFQES